MSAPDAIAVDDPTLTPAERAVRLLARMTLREKCWQLTAVPPWHLLHRAAGDDGRDGASAAETPPGLVSSLATDDPRQLRDLVARLQRVSVEQTRLGIPLLIHAEAANGLVEGGHMVFPTPVGLAATWSPEIVEQMADLIRRQMRRVGLTHALAPVMDLALDPRWGRVHETYGEDPYLAAAMSVAYTRGLQGADLTRGVVATAKHFLGYGAPQGGVNLSAFESGRRRMRDLFAYPFEAAIHLAGLRSVMNSYSDTDGVPAGVSSEILDDLLRREIGFDGFVSSDYMTLSNLVDRQLVAKDAAVAGRLGIAAGLDVELPSPFGYGDTLWREAEAGRVDVGHIDRSVARVLRAKFELGLFENPYPTESIDVAAVADEGAPLSAEAAKRSVVLLQNDGMLPLQRPQRVAVIGPHADAAALQFPTYTYPALREMTLVLSSGGMANMVGIDPEMTAWNSSLLQPEETESFVREHHGATSLLDEVSRFADATETVPGLRLTVPAEPDKLVEAVAVASRADVVVLALGGASLWFNGERTEGEASDSADIALPAAQQQLAEAVAATGTPIVAVLFQGRPYALPEVILNAAAVIVAPYGGPFGPRAVADAIFGAEEPSGRLAYSMPRHSGQIPVYHHQKAGTGYRLPVPQAVTHHYLDMPATPQFPFGHGLGYTSFEIRDVESEPTVDTSGQAVIEMTVQNSGVRRGVVIPQLYFRLSSSAVTRPAQQLAGFHRMELDPGEEKRLQFVVDAAQLGYTALDRRFVVEPGIVEYYAGFAADDRRVEGRLELTGDVIPLRSADRSFLSAAREV